jgi:hypothetical protein
MIKPISLRTSKLLLVKRRRIMLGKKSCDRNCYGFVGKFSDVRCRSAPYEGNHGRIGDFRCRSAPYEGN